MFSVINENNEISIELYQRINDAISCIKNAVKILIDMPIGLVEHQEDERLIDNLIREELGYPFSSSVFSVPCKQAVYANNYKEALAINRAIIGKGFSVQSWNICSKIKELDIFLNENPQFKNKFVETHPELSFKRVKGTSLQYKKKTIEGFQERINLLKLIYPKIDIVYEKYRNMFLKKDVANDDMLDSLVLVLSSSRTKFL